MCGHGNFDMKAYEDYFAGKITKHVLSQAEIDASIARLNTPLIPN
jgi:tryptophan synthase beta chain